MADFTVGGSGPGVPLLANQQRPGFEQVILRDVGDAARSIGRLLGADTPTPPRTPVETPGPSLGPLNAAANAAANAAQANTPNPAAPPTPEQIAALEQQAAMLHITPTWRADP